jgi:hypothetical protein
VASPFELRPARAHRRIGVNPTDPAASYGFALTIGWPAMKRLA